MYFFRYFFVAVFLQLSIGSLKGEHTINPDSTDIIDKGSLKLVKTIRGNIRPKSIAHSGQGRFFAQNMMYRHSITVYDRNYRLIKTIKDDVSPQKLGHSNLPERLKGAPVEVAFDSKGKYAYVSNYKMYGKGFNNPGMDQCTISKKFDNSYVYRINTQSLEIESMIGVGAVPKYLAVSPNDRILLVSNWCSGDLSVIDLDTEEEVRRIELGKYPRGIAIDSKSSFAYISVMGDDSIAVLNLLDYSMNWLDSYGLRPRHLVIDPSDRYLYVSLSREGEVAKIDLVKRELVKKISSGDETRSIVLTPDGRFMYVVNYGDNSISKIDAETMEVLDEIDTHEKPIGITFDPQTKLIWVACYTGTIQIFEDTDYPDQQIAGTNDLKNVPTQDPNVIKEDPKRESKSFYYVPRPKKLKPPTYYVYQEKPGNKPTEKEPEVPSSFPPLEKQLATKEKPAPQKAQVVPENNFRNRSRVAENAYFVIVGSYNNNKFAQDKAKELRRKGYDTQVLPNKQGGFRVSAGQYSAKQAAVTAANGFKKKMGISAWVLKQ